MIIISIAYNLLNLLGGALDTFFIHSRPQKPFPLDFPKVDITLGYNNEIRFEKQGKTFTHCKNLPNGRIFPIKRFASGK